MTPLEWKQLESTIQNHSTEEKEKLRTMLDRKLPIKKVGTDPLFGLMSDEPELVDRVLEAALLARE
jgi:hypothetical protein